jgi:hypothetical protein
VTLSDFEAGKRSPHPRTLEAIRAALEKAGVIFVDENGEGAGVDWQFNMRLWTTGRILVTSCETLGPAVSIERVRQCVSFPWRNEIALENASVDRPVDEFHF